MRSHEEDLVVERAADESRLQVDDLRLLHLELLHLHREAEVAQGPLKVAGRRVERARASQVPLADPSRERLHVPLEATLYLGLRFAQGRPRTRVRTARHREHEEGGMRVRLGREGEQALGGSPMVLMRKRSSTWRLRFAAGAAAVAAFSWAAAVVAAAAHARPTMTKGRMIMCSRPRG